MALSIIEKASKFFLSSKNYLFIVILVLLALLLILQYARGKVKFEGFQQKEPFVTERGDSVYDGFYAEIYDKLYKSESRAESDTLKIVESTQPDKENSAFLDIGCGTGCVVDVLKRQGYNAIGVDKSKAMVEVGKERRPKTCGALQTNDVADPMLFERGVFTHILCLSQTIYEFPDKVQFFRNCKHWLVPGGYLLVHLVEPLKYNAIIPLGQPKGIVVKPVSKDGKRVTDTAIDFIDFKYKSSFDFDGLKDGVVVQIETFTDSKSSHVRRNEHTLYMNTPTAVLEDARYCGFLLQGEFVSGEDPEQKVYILKAL